MIDFKITVQLTTEGDQKLVFNDVVTCPSARSALSTFLDHIPILQHAISSDVRSTIEGSFDELSATHVTVAGVTVDVVEI